LTQEMIAQLGRLHPATLSVIARTSVMRYKKSETPIDQIGRELGVDYVLEGSAQKEGNRVRIAAELIRVGNQTQLWADSFEREMSGILALQSDVARKVASALALKLLPAEQARLADARTVNPEAYEAYLKGVQYSSKLTRADLDTAESYLKMALQKQPDFAAAYLGLAGVWECRNQFAYAPPSEAVPKAKEAALKAVALDDTGAGAHFTLAELRTWSELDPVGAGPEWQRAVELDPNNAGGLTSYSHYLAIVGRVDEAMRQIDRAVSLDPYDVMIRSFRAFDLVFARRFDEAIAEARKALAMQPGHPLALWGLFDAQVGKGMNREAISTMKEYLPIYGVADAGAVMEKGFAEGGFKGAMRRAGDALGQRASRGEATPADVAVLYVCAGDKGRALDWLEKGYEMRDPNLPYISVSPQYDPLRTEPRFQALLRKMGLPTGSQPGTPRAAGASS
jgi:TolB-like protein